MPLSGNSNLAGLSLQAKTFNRNFADSSCVQDFLSLYSTVFLKRRLCVPVCGMDDGGVLGPAQLQHDPPLHLVPREQLELVER
jgi:hypothetical protein